MSGAGSVLRPSVRIGLTRPGSGHARSLQPRLPLPKLDSTSPPTALVAVRMDLSLSEEMIVTGGMEFMTFRMEQN